MVKDDLASLPGLGPKSAAQLREIGVTDRADFLGRDPFLLYQRLKTRGRPVSLNFLYAMIGAQTNTSWQQVKQDQKTAILLRLEEMGLI